jgi:hypothetical protein
MKNRLSILFTLGILVSSAFSQASDLLSVINTKSVALCRPIRNTANIDETVIADLTFRGGDEYLVSKKMDWFRVPYPLDSALSNALISRATEAETLTALPDNILEKLKIQKVKYLPIIYRVSGKGKPDTKDIPIAPVYGGIAIHSPSGEITEDFIRFDFYLSLFSIDSNAPLFVHKLSTVRCSGSANECIAITAIKDIIAYARTGSAGTTANLPDSQSLTGLKAAYGASTGLFVLGSIATFAGFGVIVTGNTSSAHATGTAFFIVGQSGLLLTGLSNVILSSSLRSYMSEPVPGMWKGWAVHAGALVLIGTGLVLVGQAISHDSQAYFYPGILCIGLGEVLSPLAWNHHRKYRKELTKAYQAFIQ